MNRGDLLRHLRKHGCHLKREGRSHSLWTNPATGAVEAVPRHTEIWSSFVTGQGKLGGYVTSLPDAKRAELEGHMRRIYACGMPMGPRAFTNWFWVVRGHVPGSS